MKTPPVILEYTPPNAMTWRVERFDLLTAEFPMDEPWDGHMGALHALAAQSDRQWLVVRRLYGIAPLIPEGDMHPDDLRLNTREEICAALSTTAKGLEAELDAVRGRWLATLPNLALTTEKEESGEEKPQGELTIMEDLELLRQHGFPEDMFEAMTWDGKQKEEIPRSREVNRIEQDWFTKRVREWDKMLSEPQAESIAREALINELYLRRLQAEMAKLSPTSPRWQELLGAKQEIEVRREAQLEKLNEMFPESNVAGKVSFRGVVSELNLAHRDYYGDANNVLRDKIYTAAEIEILQRQSVQQPEAPYRFGQNVAIVMSMHFLYDRNYKDRVKPSLYKKLDAGFRAGANQVREELQQALVDLEDGIEHGEGSDFEDLDRFPAKQGAGEMKT